MADKVKVSGYSVKGYTRNAPKSTTKKKSSTSYKSVGNKPAKPMDISNTSKGAPIKFPANKKINGKVYKLATLHKGMSYLKANSTYRINIDEGNKAVLTKMKMDDGNYTFAVYVRKS